MIRKSVKQKYVDAICRKLADEGERIILRACATQDTTSRSGNMDDAFGAAVYYKGRSVERRYVTNPPVAEGPHKGWSKAGIPSDTGRGYLDDFFDNYKASPVHIELVCVNAVYYTKILEEGRQGGLGIKYRIISQTMDDMMKLASKYKGRYSEL